MLPLRHLLSWLAVAGALFLAGCESPFAGRHVLVVDALAAPDAPKPAGLSYRLVARKSTLSSTPAQIPVVKACVDAALAGVGLFEAPATAPADLFINLSFGQSSTPRVDPSARETFLQLSVRTNPGRSLDQPTGPEVWDVRIAVLGLSGRIESAMPLLAYAAAANLGTDSKVETRIEIPKDSPAVKAVRESALKRLDAAAPAPAPTTPTTGS
jgi:hypothetical protein